MQAHRTICPVKGKQVEIDLPEVFLDQVPDLGYVEVIVLPITSNKSSSTAPDTEAWLQHVWGCIPDFPDRPSDLPPEPVAAL